LKKPVVLRIYKDSQLLGVKQFTVEQIVIGRRGEVQLELDGDQVSNIHAALEERDSAWYICDLGSETGTSKNGAPVLDAAIESGDVIQIGPFKIEFYLGAPKLKAASTAANSDSGDTVSNLEPVVSLGAPELPLNHGAFHSVPPSTVSELPARVPERLVPLQEESRVAPRVASSSKGARERSPSDRLGSVHKRKAKGSKTFAPPSRYSNVKDFVRPTKGTVVEVLVAWRERVIATKHFSSSQKVFVGSHPDCDIVLPVFASGARKVLLLRLDSHAVVSVGSSMAGELIRGHSSSSFVELLRENRLKKEGAGYTIALEQGEMIKIELSDQISILVRYVSDSPKPVVAPLLDLTASEFAAGVLAIILVALLGLYMFLYTPPQILADEGLEEPLRTAMIIVPPTPSPVPAATPSPEPPPEVKPQPTPPPTVVKATPSPKASDLPKVALPKAATNLTTKQDPGKSANAAPNKNKVGPRALTSPKQGGSIKTANKEGAQMKSPPRDVTKSGVFSVFGGGGANDQLAQNTSGSGELAGLAGAATGRSGYGENRAGQGLGSAVKDTGVGGSGTALTGIAGGIGTQGRGSGNSGYGVGGLGQRASTKIVTGGTEESYSGTIDREAIRRVVKANERVIRTCYERQLNRNPDLFGKLVLSWEIGEQGRVVSVGVKSNEIGSKEVAECILARLRTWKFPEPPVNQIVEVAYPFFFSN
jgi:outer membrane biosynthesis protein TonB